MREKSCCLSIPRMQNWAQNAQSVRDKQIQRIKNQEKNMELVVQTKNEENRKTSEELERKQCAEARV